MSTLVMGILNVTPDSFSDGGRWDTVDAAIARGLELRDQGASIVDVGGESTRPGAARIEPAEEQERVVPVIRALAAEGVTLSIDTMHASTARAAVEAGAAIVNDVSGGLADPDMAKTAADLACDFIAMHWRAHSAEMDKADRYEDVVAEVGRELEARVDALVGAGVASDRIVLDPGLGFAKVTDSNWPLIARWREWAGDHRVLIGASRKRFLGAAIASGGGDGADPSNREAATTAVTTVCALEGVWAVRVHDAAASRDAISVVSRLTTAGYKAR
ncbi:dihydropteroate synthase [Demequina sp. NBRC 110054]|uniref:dihydropteroate synthase n=1 Tax=Demequina sp. NBRC 110054 TaxID=1570343 RepID=UPI001F2DFC02|nr:dihydropteroate synthase [Demequina sp. NBRC 110054]